jgi:S-methylmethionine-dependent homocysteine/selenocysteine methylase
LDESFKEVVAEKGKGLFQTKLLSVAYGPDGYVADSNETAHDASEWLWPQIWAAQKFGYRPIAEATTTLNRLHAAWRTASDYGLREIDIGLAFDSHGHLAADGTNLETILEHVDKNQKKLGTKVTIGANCGSLTGIEKAARANPGALRFAYANSVDIEDLDHLGNLGNGTVHHHRDPVTVEEFARVARENRFDTVSLCCGFSQEDLQKLKAHVHAE